MQAQSEQHTPAGQWIAIRGESAWQGANSYMHRPLLLSAVLHLAMPCLLKVADTLISSCL